VLCEQFGVSRSTHKYWRGHRGVIYADRIEIRSLVSEKPKLSNGSAGSRSITAMESTSVAVVPEGLGLVSCQLPQYADKKALQPHVVMSNELNRQGN
jgi:putative transposase